MDDHDLAGGPGAVTAVAHRLDPPRWYVIARPRPPRACTELAEYGSIRLGGPDERRGRLADSSLTEIDLYSQAPELLLHPDGPVAGTEGD
ncbi:hypothetical protein [Streptomyces sp. NPDC002619]|uniref:hypothetical protein n=1 Tax=Streptomyces sp. NPDC002619 TaxID=3364655 RepID=UPI0036C764C9